MHGLLAIDRNKQPNKLASSCPPTSMAQAFQFTHACLPVTALHTVQLNNDLLILAGHGSFLSVIDARGKNLLSCQRVFVSAQIHGITSDASPADNNEPRPLLIWGGCFICLASLRVSDPDVDTPNTKLIFKEVVIGSSIRTVDWILDACFNYGPSSSVAPACLVTAHNDLVALHFGSSHLPFRFRTDVLHSYPTLCRFSSGEDSLLHSARVSCDRSNGSFLITAGTISGHVLLLGCNLHPNKMLKLSEVPTGHKGAVFGVDRFKGYFVSCSDDREVRVGLLRRLNAASETSGKTSERASDTDYGMPVEPDTGEYREIELCKHGSRVWGVKFVTIGTDLTGIVSIGEDGICKFAQLRPQKAAQLTSDHYHVGKNIWSLADGQLGEEHLIITGGADGAIVLREISRRLSLHSSDTQEIVRSPPKHGGSYLDHFETELSPLFAQLKVRAAARSGSDAKPPSIKQYEFTSHSCLLALTDSGYLLRGIADEDAPKDKNSSGRDTNVMPTDTLSMPSKWSFKHRFKIAFRARPVMSNSRDHLVFLGNSNGRLFVCFPEGVEDEIPKCVVQLDAPISWLHIAGVEYLSNSSRKYCIVTYSDAKKGAWVVFVTISTGTETTGAVHSPEQSTLYTTYKFRGPINALTEATVGFLGLGADFEPTCATVLHHTQIIVLGSKRSELAICKPVYVSRGSEGSPVYCFGIHVFPWPGDDRITSVSEILSHNPSDCREEYLLTTGRNGMYAVLSINLEGARFNIKVLDRSTTPFGSGIEGSYCARAPQALHRSSERHAGAQFWTRQWQHEGAGRVSSGDLILYGFDSKKFLVWNESQRSLIVSIDCENAHRPWAYNTYAPKPEQGGQDCPDHGPFAWTQAKFLNVVTIGRSDHSVVQRGGHGQEIKALSVSPLPYQDLRHGILNGRLIATGAEDTLIRFFAIGASAEAHTRNKMICIRTLKQHTTGVQHLSFSPCSKYLFSSGGGEELYAWRIRQGVPGVGIGVRLVFSFPRQAKSSAVRITDFKVDRHDEGMFRVAVVYSDSMIKFFHFTPESPTTMATAVVLRCFYYVEKCVVRVNDHVENVTLTAGTQGKCLTQINHYGNGGGTHRQHRWQSCVLVYSQRCCTHR